MTQTKLWLTVLAALILIGIGWWIWNRVFPVHTYTYPLQIVTPAVPVYPCTTGKCA